MSTSTSVTPAASGSPLSRYLIVTIVATPANLIAISLLLALTGWPPLVCNLTAATLVTIPSFIACSTWVWEVDDRRSGRALAFWSSSVGNVAAASLAMWLLQSLGAPRRVLAVTPLAVYTALWFARFALLDRVVFRTPTLSVSEVPVPTADR